MGSRGGPFKRIGGVEELEGSGVKSTASIASATDQIQLTEFLTEMNSTHMRCMTECQEVLGILGI